MSEKENINICPKCGYKRTEGDNEYVSLEECPSCGIIYKKIKEIPPQQVNEPINIEKRVLCGDGCCIGIIKNGLCTECGKTLEETKEQKPCTSNSYLIECSVCKKEISINANSCPFCGEPNAKEGATTTISIDNLTNLKQIFGIAGACILFIGVFLPIVRIPVMGSMNYFQNGKGDGIIIVILAMERKIINFPICPIVVRYLVL